MIEKSLEKLSEYQEKYPVLILSVVFLFTLFMGFHAINLETDASLDTMYGPNSDHVQLKNLVSNEFGSTDVMYILVTINDDVNDKNRIQDIRHPDVLHAMDVLKTSILEEKSVSQVQSVADIFKEEFGGLPETPEQTKEYFSLLPQEIRDSVVAKDYTALNMIVQMNIANKPGSLETAEEVIVQKIDDALTPLGIQFILAGEPTLINRIMNLLINDNLKTVGIAIIFIVIILFIYFRSGAIAVLAAMPLLLALVWLAGTMTLLDIRITFMTAAVGSMMVGMGIDYSVHMTHGFLQSVKRGRVDAVRIAVGSVGSALIASAATTVAGFLAMLFGISPSSKIQGTVLSLGIGYAFIGTVLVLPCLLVVYRKLVYSDLDKIMFRLGVEDKQEKSILYTPLAKLAHLQTSKPWWIIATFVILTIFIVPGMSKLWLDTSNDNWIPPNDPVMNALDEITNKFGGLDTQDFLLTIQKDADQGGIHDLRDPRVLKKLHELDKAMEKRHDINSYRSPTDGIVLAYGGIPHEIEEIKTIIDENEDVREYFNEDFTTVRLTAYGDDFGSGGPSDEMTSIYNDWLYEAESVSFPQGVEYFAQGGVRSDLELDNLLAVDTMKTTGIGFLFVFLLSLFIYRSFTVGFLSFLPIIFAITWTVGLMGWVNLPFTVLTSGMMAIVMGMGIDFSIHLIHNTKSFLRKGDDITQAVTKAVTSTGEAISVTTLTTVVGFCSLLLATLLATQRLGLTLAIAVFSAFVICILIVPATLVIEHNFKNRHRIPK